MKNYNSMSELDVSDNEVVQELGLDPSLVGKPELNNAAFDKIYARNVVATKARLLEEGHGLVYANKHSKKEATALRKEAEKFLKTVQQDRGY